jgi:hypothetical protein
MWLLFYGITLALYFPFLGAGYFSDDFLFFFVSAPPHLGDHFLMRGAASHAYRPAESIILVWIQAHFGLNTIPIHLISMAAHAALCCGVWVLAARLGVGRIEQGLASGLMLVTQLAPGAVLGNDSMSQAVSTALGTAGCILIAIAYLDWADSGRRKLRQGPMLAGVGAISAALFFKETALGFVLTAGVLAACAAIRERTWLERCRFVARQLAPLACTVGLYLALRARSAGPAATATEAYHASLGLNVIKNLAQCGYFLLTPISSVFAGVSAGSRDWRTLAVCGLTAFGVAGILLAGVAATPRKRLVSVLGACVLTTLFPAVLLQHISELYVYNAAPGIALLLGIALAAFWRGGLARRTVSVAGIVLLVGGQFAADRQKAALMNGNGSSAAALIAAAREHITAMPPGGEVILTEEPSSAPTYSVYVLHGLDVLRFGAKQIGPLCGRSDVQVKIIPKPEIQRMEPGRQRMILELKGGSLRPL